MSLLSSVEISLPNKFFDDGACVLIKWPPDKSGKRYLLDVPDFRTAISSCLRVRQSTTLMFFTFIKDARSVSVYLYIRSQILNYV